MRKPYRELEKEGMQKVLIAESYKDQVKIHIKERNIPESLKANLLSYTTQKRQRDISLGSAIPTVQIPITLTTQSTIPSAPPLSETDPPLLKTYPPLPK